MQKEGKLAGQVTKNQGPPPTQLKVWICCCTQQQNATQNNSKKRQDNTTEKSKYNTVNCNTVDIIGISLSAGEGDAKVPEVGVSTVISGI